MKQAYDLVWISFDGVVERHPYMREHVAQAIRHYRKNKSWIDGYLVLKQDRGIGIYDRDLNCLKFFLKTEESHIW